MAFRSTTGSTGWLLLQLLELEIGCDDARSGPLRSGFIPSFPGNPHAKLPDNVNGVALHFRDRSLDRISSFRRDSLHGIASGNERGPEKVFREFVQAFQLGL